MRPLSEFKKALGPVANELSEKEIRELRDLQYRLAAVIYDMWTRELTKQKNNGEEELQT